jgi:hypothetical protein
MSVQARHSSIAVVIGIVLGLAVSLFGPSEASRNSSGTYTLPAGNPVVTGTTISSTWANNTLDDIKTEITSSLDRSGRGAMLAPLQCSNGTVSLPSLTFGSDTDTGLYRIGANNPAMAAGGTKVQDWTSTGTTVTGTAAVTGATTVTGLTTLTALHVSSSSGFDAGMVTTGGITSTTAVTNGAAHTCTGNGSGAGIVSTGGGSNGAGGTFTGGATNGRGLTGAGTGSGPGAHLTGGTDGNGSESYGQGTHTGAYGAGGGTSGLGVEGVGGAPNGSGVKGTGTGTGFGGVFANGTDATGAARTDAIIVTNGDIGFSGVANPNSDVGFSNRVTPKNINKAWARLTVTGGNGGSFTTAMVDGFNITSVSRQTNLLVRITFETDFSNTSYLAIGKITHNTSAGYEPEYPTYAVGTYDFSIEEATGGGIDLDAASNANTWTVHFLFLGAN